MRTPSTYQQAIYDFVLNGTGNAIVTATAGSGKTTTCEGVAERVTGSLGFFAFNKHIATELQRRLPDHATAMTIHGLGNSALWRTAKDAGKSIDLKDDKYKLLARALMNARGWDELRSAGYKELEGALIKLASFARLTLTDERDTDALEAMVTRYNLDLDWDVLETALAYLPALLADAVEDWRANARIDFTDMIWLPVRLNLRVRTFKFVIIDEAQDLNRCQSALVLKAVARGGRVLAVGDKNQSLYAFAGADHTSMDRLKAELNATELPLSVCYRCPQSHVELAQRLVPEMEWAPGAKDGVIGTVAREHFTRMLRPGDLILCRTTAPLVKAAFEALRAGVPAKIRGRDIASGLKTIIEKVTQKGFNARTFGAQLDAYHETQSAKILAKHKGDHEAAAMERENLADRVAVIATVFAESGAQRAEDLHAALDRLFSDTDDASVATFSSVHRAKGLEAERVHILRRDLLPHPRAERPDDIIQERNAEFVALTRSKSELYFIVGDEAA